MNQNLFDEALRIYQQNIDLRDTVIDKQTKVIEKIDPELAKKLKRIDNFKVVK